MTTFEKWNYYYSKGWATKEQLHHVVELHGLTETGYETITGEAYV